MLIDTHAHLNFSAYKDDLDEVVQRCLDLEMKVINVGSQLSTSKRAVAIAEKYPQNMYAAVGLHPIHLFELEFDITELPFKTRQEDFSASAYEELAKSPGVVAIGETGLDYFHMPVNMSTKEFDAKQKWVFLKHLQLAKKLDLPVIMHCRGEQKDMQKAYTDMLSILKDFGYSRGVVHCFAADWAIARRFLDLGFMISFTGIITYPKTKELEKVVKNTPLEKMMIETDAPYLAPQIVRGKRNEPRFVQYVADRVAQIKGLTLAEVSEATKKQAIEFFRLK